MSTDTIRVKGARVTVVFDRTEYFYLIGVGAKRGANQLVLDLQKHLKELLNRPGSGKQHASLNYRSSAPGQPPARQTGNLARSWQAGQPVLITRGSTIGYRLGSPVKYAARLEFGDGDLAARPYLRPALAAVAPTVNATFIKFVKQALSDGVKRKLQVTDA
jgi:hypothetical protein